MQMEWNGIYNIRLFKSLFLIALKDFTFYCHHICEIYIWIYSKCEHKRILIFNGNSIDATNHKVILITLMWFNTHLTRMKIYTPSPTKCNIQWKCCRLKYISQIRFPLFKCHSIAIIIIWVQDVLCNFLFI